MALRELAALQVDAEEPEGVGGSRGGLWSRAEGRSRCPWVCELTNDTGYVLYSAFGSFFIPMFVMLFFYWRIYRAAVQTTRAINQVRLFPERGTHAAPNRCGQAGRGVGQRSGALWPAGLRACATLWGAPRWLGLETPPQARAYVFNAAFISFHRDTLH